MTSLIAIHPEVTTGDLTPEGIEVVAPMRAEWAEILSPEALRFVAALARRFESTRRELLGGREGRQLRLDMGEKPGFLPETRSIRNGDWTVAPIPADLLDRRVEITGPVDRKMIINALNSGANVFMADFEDSTTPTFANVVEGQINLRDAVRGTIEYVAPETGKVYRLKSPNFAGSARLVRPVPEAEVENFGHVATLMVRPRGWHLDEKHILVDGKPVSGSLFDFGLFFFHNAHALIEKGSGPYFYLPKLESHLEARLWNDVFNFAQDALGVPRGTIRATVLIETILAAFEMDEILFELRDHSAGLNCGRWDYIFSFIKKFSSRPDFVLPDRGQVTMTRHFLESYSKLVIKTCHRRGIHAMGGMAAQIPIRADADANRIAMEKVAADKRREAKAGHDGTWVAHPGLVSIAREIFDAEMPGPNQIDQQLDIEVTPEDLLAVPDGTITEAGLRQNVNVGLLYLEAWLRGTGCVPLYNLMEDAATAEISRTQLWQWIRHGARLEDGRIVDEALYRRIVDEEVAAIGAERGDGGRHLEACRRVFDRLVLSEQLEDFLTVPAYEEILANEHAAA